MTDKSKFRIEIPERFEDEPDATDRQIRFIGHLLDEVEAEGFSYDITSLGKWQASSLINRLLEIQGGELIDRITINDTEHKSSRSLKWLILLIILIFVLLLIIFGGGCWYDSYGYDPFGNPSPEQTKLIEESKLSEEYHLSPEEIESVPLRFQKSYKELPLFRERWRRHVDNPLIIGMSKSEVREKWGQPSNISTYTSSFAKHDTWEYGELDTISYGGSVYLPPDAILYFKNGFLISIYEP